MENVPSCLTCINGSKIICTNNILCRKYGVLASDSPCKKYILDLTKKEVRKRRTVKKINLNLE